MAKRDGKTITLGSGKLYMATTTGTTLPTKDTLFVANNLLAYIKGGATISYEIESYEEKDDLGLVKKVITTSEEATLKCGLVTWNGNTLKKLMDNCTVTEDSTNHLRTAKLGGAGNAQGQNYAIGFEHTDTTDGNVWVMLVGRNGSGFSFTFSPDEGTVLEPEFKALPHDTDGTLIELIEELPTT